jgi:DNA-binding transcriptional LysR family regulator
MAPTKRAIELTEPLRAALLQMRRVLAAPKAFVPRDCDVVFRVATNDYVSYVVLPPLLRRLAQEAPKARLQLVALDAETVWSRLEDGTLDLALQYFREIPGELHSRSLFRERYVCIARRGHPVIRKKLTLAKYLALDHIVMTPYLTGLIDARLATLGHTRRVALGIPNFLLIPELVAQSQLVATMGERVASAYAKHLPLRVYPLPLALDRVVISQVWHGRRHADAAHQWLRGVIAEVSQTV